MKLRRHVNVKRAISIREEIQEEISKTKLEIEGIIR